MKNQNVKPGYLFSTGYTNYVFVLLFLLYMFDYIDRMVVTNMFVSIERDLGISLICEAAMDNMFRSQAQTYFLTHPVFYLYGFVFRDF